MTTLLVDASVWLSALNASDQNHSEATAFISRARAGSFNTAALDLTLYELANVPTVNWREPDQGIALAKEVELACVGRIVRADSELMRAAAPIAAEHQISVYDAAYAAAGQACRWPLVSFDVRDLISNGLAVFPRDAAG